MGKLRPTTRWGLARSATIATAMSVWVFGVDFCDDVDQEWETHGDDYEFEEEIEFEDQYEFGEKIEYVDKGGFVEKNEFVDKYGLVDKNEFVKKTGLVYKIGFEDEIEFVYKARARGRRRRLHERSGECVRHRSLGGHIFHRQLEPYKRQSPMLDSGSMLHIAPLSYCQAYPLTPDPLARPAETVTGGSVERFGRRRIMTETLDGRRVSVNYAIGNVSRPFLIVPGLVASGAFVWFGPSGSGVAHGPDLYAAVRAYEAGTYPRVWSQCMGLRKLTVRLHVRLRLRFRVRAACLGHRQRS